MLRRSRSPYSNKPPHRHRHTINQPYRPRYLYHHSPSMPRRRHQETIEMDCRAVKGRTRANPQPMPMLHSLPSTSHKVRFLRQSWIRHHRRRVLNLCPVLRHITPIIRIRHMLRHNRRRNGYLLAVILAISTDKNGPGYKGKANGLIP